MRYAMHVPLFMPVKHMKKQSIDYLATEWQHKFASLSILKSVVFNCVLDVVVVCFISNILNVGWPRAFRTTLEIGHKFV